MTHCPLRAEVGAMTFLTEMNLVEWAISVFALLALVLSAKHWRPQLRWRGTARSALAPNTSSWGNPHGNAVGTVLGVVALFIAFCLAVSEVSQFMTLDETAFGEVLRNPADRNIASNWAQGASHTANLIWIPVTRLMQAFSARDATIDATLKTIHWLVGFALMMGIVLNVARLSPSQPGVKSVMVATLAGVLLVLPVDNLALKTLNYDAISLFGSVLAITLLARAQQEERPDLLWAGLLFASLAAQEKLNASLVLLILCLAAGVIEASMRVERRARAAAIATLKALCLALLVSACSYVLAALCLIGEPALAVLIRTAPLFMEILTVWIYAPLRFVFGIGNSLADPAARVGYSTAAAVLTFVLLPLASALIVKLWPRLQILSRAAAALSPFVFPLGIAIVLFVGVAGLHYAEPVFAPMVPLDSSLMTIGSFNGVQLHFGMPSAVLHRVAAIAFAYGVVLAALPTALIAVAAVTAARLAWRPRSLPFFDLLFAAAIAAPAILALLNTPTFNRYLNLPILLATIVIVVRIVSTWASVFRANRSCVIALPALILAMVVEVAPFRPLHAAFRPITVNYGGADSPAPGRLNFSWTGWGEEAILAGKLIDKECRKAGSLAGIDCRNVRIWSVYKGRWFPRAGTRVQPLEGGFFADKDWASGPDIYYVMNRQLLVGGLLSAFPSIEPDFVIQYRGFAMAWVYRGDRLKSSGYHFIWGS
ncbi:hypothetical protein SAMN04488115_11616 [Bosea lathyri]|uniref:Uncharacterized protein n=2 Tax=Bosea lathyri TaxID=1036778 RepID=A0A1H6D5G7_9HYPH|nr:hypothetical protein SAMN04488115_11616 [Bosea lathyri]